MKSLPVIATDVGGIPEIVDNNKSGILIPVNKIDSLYRAMEKLYSDARLQKSFGKAGRKKFLTHFELSTIVRESYVQLYKNGQL